MKSRYFVWLLLTLCLAFLPVLAVAQEDSNSSPDSDLVQPPVKSTCSTQNNTDMCIFQGPNGHNGALRIASGLKYLWYGSPSLNGIVRSTTKGATKVCAGLSGGASPFGITLGPDKRMWFTEYGSSNVGAVTTSCKVTEYPLGFSPSDAIEMTLGADKNLWMPTDFNGIVRITPTGGVSAFSLPDGNSAQPTSVTLGADGNIWFLEANGPCFQGQNFTNIGKVTPSGAVTEYAVGLHGNGYGIANGPDGRIWFADPGGCNGFTSRVGVISTNGSGLKYFSSGLPAFVDTIINGGDGNLYFGTFTSQIGRLTTKGVVSTVWNLPSSPAFPVLGMTIGPDTNIWFSDNAGDFIGVLYIHPVISSFTPTSGPVGTSVKIKGGGFTGTTAVAFGGTKAKFTVNSGFQITATVPTGAGTGKITVTGPGGTATSTKSFTVN